MPAFLSKTLSSKSFESYWRCLIDRRIRNRTQPPQAPIKEQLQQLIKSAADSEVTLPQLIQNLHESDVEVRAGLTRTGKSKGISYEYEGQHFSGSQLGAAFTFPGPQKYLGVNYDPGRDNARMQDLIDRRLVRDEQIDNLITAVSSCMDVAGRSSLKLDAYWAQWDSDQQTLVVAQYDHQEDGDRSVIEARAENNKWVLDFDDTYQRDVDALMQQLKQPRQEGRGQALEQERQQQQQERQV